MRHCQALSTAGKTGVRMDHSCFPGFLRAKEMHQALSDASSASRSYDKGSIVGTHLVHSTQATSWNQASCVAHPEAMLQEGH